LADTPNPTKGTLGLTGLTVNAMALIAPGAFLWLTFAMQSLYGAPMAPSDMWFGILLALGLCFATAVSYAELSRIYPGAGSSYFYAEQAFLSKTKAFKFARIAKFIVGWASHLYYWVYPGVMVGVTGIVMGYMFGQIFPNVINTGVPAPLFMAFCCVIFALLVGYIASRGITGSTAVNTAINVIQISALMVFAVMAIGYRMHHGPQTLGYVIAANDGVTTTGEKITAGMATDMVQAQDSNGNNLYLLPASASAPAASAPAAAGAAASAPAVATTTQPASADGKTQYDPQMVPATLDDYTTPVANAGSTDPNKLPTRQYFSSASDVIRPHNFGYTFIQACIAILILVGFESCTALGEQAKNAKRDIPRAVLLSLVIQGAICYLFEYFAAKYMLNSNYGIPSAGGSAAPIGDMMQMAGMYFFGSSRAGWWFMMIQATTVFLALIGTTLSCLNTGAQVTYAMGRDGEVAETFGLLSGKSATPIKAVWTLTILSMVIGIIAVFLNFCGGAAQTDATIAALPHNIWYSFGLMSNATAMKIPQGMLIVTLISNFGTFVLYMLTNWVAIVAFREHHAFHGIKHMFIPIFGLCANLSCMLFYLIGPFFVAGMSWKEPYCALAFAAVWGIYGLIYFKMNSGKKGKSIYVQTPTTANQPVNT
jgi:APA family basic amino acid/polyamine antiporter